MPAVLLPNGKQQFFTTPGVPAVGYKLATFAAGTSTPQATWSDSGKIGANTNPIILDARGEAVIFWDGTYKVQLQDSTGALIWTVDNISPLTVALLSNFSPDTGAVNAYVAVGGASTTAYVTGLNVTIKINTTNTGASTLNYGGLGVRNVFLDGHALSGGELQANNIYEMEYDGSVFQLLNWTDPTRIRSAAEITAGVTPVNFARLPMDVDRYATNTTPGTTDMTAAFNAAVAVAMVAGGTVTYGATSNYLVTGIINCTVAGAPNQPGILIRGSGVSSQDANFGILAKHALMSVFDCTGNDSITFENVSIKTDATVFPQTGILTARNSTGSSLIIRLTNVRIVGKFGTACFYNYGSEDDVLVGCYFANYNPALNTKAAMWTGNNVSVITSPFVAIATGPRSCIDHTVVGCQFLNASGGATCDAIYIEQVDSLKIYGGWAHSAATTGFATSTITSAAAGVMTVGGVITGAFTVGMQVNGTGVPVATIITSLGTGTGGAGTYNISTSTTWGPSSVVGGLAGRALIYVDMTNGPSNFLTVDGLTGEVGTPLQTYGINVSNNAFTPTGWTIVGTKLPNGGNAIAAGGPLPTLDNARIFNTPTQAGNGLLWTGTVQNSTLDMGIGLTIGTSLKNHLIGDSSSWTITTVTGGSKTETGTANRTFAPGIASGANNWTAVGAITQRGKLTYNSNKVDFTIVIAGATSIACTAAAIIGLPFTATDVATAIVLDTTSGTTFAATISGSVMTMLTAIAATPHTIVIQGSCFVS